MPGNVHWAFDPGFPPSRLDVCCRATVGSYVRLVGTMWEDEVHEFGLGPVVGAAHDCWNEGATAGRGWMEMHPVDYMALIEKPAPRTDVVDSLVVCERPSSSGTTTSVTKDVTLPGGRPSPDAHVGCEYRIDPDFTAEKQIVVHRMVPGPTGFHIEVTLDRQSQSAKFKATYHVFWTTDASVSANDCRKLA